MKKLCLLLFFIIISLEINLTSCTNEPAPLVKSFTANVTGTCNGEKLKARIISNNQKFLLIEILSPSSMKGYKYTYKDSTLSIKYKTFNVKAQTNYIPNTGFSSIMYNVLSSLSKEQNCRCTGSDKAFAYYKGKCESGEYDIKAEYNSGAIREINIKSIDFTAKLDKIKIK